MATVAPARPARAVSVFPPQHGAWAFLGLPVVVGAAVADWTPLIVLLAVTWVAAYPASYFVLTLVAERTRRSPRPQRFVRPLLTWAIPAAACAIPLVWLRPWLVWIGAAYVLAFAVNVRYASRRADRALANDIVFIVECAAMVAVTWAIGAGSGAWTPPVPVPAQVWILVVAVAVLQAGSTIHVKSLIRERADPRYRAASRVVAVASVGLAVALATWWGLPAGAWLVVPFAYFAIRAFVVDRLHRPGVLGMVELAGFVLLAAAAFALT